MTTTTHPPVDWYEARAVRLLCAHHNVPLGSEESIQLMASSVNEIVFLSNLIKAKLPNRDVSDEQKLAAFAEVVLAYKAEF